MWIITKYNNMAVNIALLFIAKANNFDLNMVSKYSQTAAN